MKPTFQREAFAASPAYFQTAIQTKSLWARFIDFCTREDVKHHYGWIGVSLAAHGCVLTPITLFAIILTANVFTLWIIASFSMAAVVVVNLSGISTKYTIPVLLLSALVDIAVIIAAFTIPV